MQRRDNSGPANPIGAPASAQGSATERPERGERPSGERHGGERPERHGGHFGDRPGGERPERPERPGGHFGDRPGGHFHSDRPGGGPPRGGRGRDFRSRRKVCMFCVEHIRDIDYKDVAHLRRYLSDRGKIEPRRKTGTCAKHQRRLSTALKNARVMALLPYTAVHIRGS